VQLARGKGLSGAPDFTAKTRLEERTMAARPTWKGFLKISLVNIPVRVFPATDSAATISFNQLHAECQTRIQQKRWCPKCEREVPISEVAKGYEFEKGRYVVMTDEDMSKVRPESTRVIDLVQFTDAAAIDPIYVERPYYLAPDGPMAREAFAVMREGMIGKAGIGKLALYGREYLVAVQPRERGLVMYTMRHAKEVRSMENIEELDQVPSKVKPDEIKLARQVIGNFEGELDLTEYSDKYQEELQRIIDAKVAGEEVVATAEETPPKVVNLMDALRQSLDRVSTGKKKAAKAEIEKPARAAAAPKRRAR
jgi:DNA end-binding protein Ku